MIFIWFITELQTLAILNKIVNSAEKENNPRAARGLGGHGRPAHGEAQQRMA